MMLFTYKTVESGYIYMKIYVNLPAYIFLDMI